MPERIQRRRTAGWRMPAGAIYVGRPTKWGNPFTVSSALETGYAHDDAEARQLVVDCFRDCLTRGGESTWWFVNGSRQFISITEDLDQLAGHDLACWCPLDQPCHADVLLELANG
ncbi:MAG: DUF4326 domain-containing protein [Mycobacterium sp.]|jgi:hypothetical protein|nr:MAG: DUF4326 domain-containing protein [Mycobacterium sp.]